MSNLLYQVVFNLFVQNKGLGRGMPIIDPFTGIFLAVMAAIVIVASAIMYAVMFFLKEPAKIVIHQEKWELIGAILGGIAGGVFGLFSIPVTNLTGVDKTILSPLVGGVILGAITVRFIASGIIKKLGS